MLTVKSYSAPKIVISEVSRGAQRRIYGHTRKTTWVLRPSKCELAVVHHGGRRRRIAARLGVGQGHPMDWS